MKKSFWKKKIIISFVVGLLSVALGSFFINENISNSNLPSSELASDETLSDKQINSSSRSFIEPTKTATINFDKSINLPDDGFYGSYNSLCSTPYGIFVTTINGVMMLNDKTLEVVWKINSTIPIGTVNYRVMHALYNSEYSQSGSTAGTLVVLHLYGNGCQVSLINPENGEVFDQTPRLDIAQTDSGDLSTILVPLSSASGTISGNSYIIQPRGYLSDSVRNKGEYQFWIKNGGFNGVEKLPAIGKINESYVLLSAGFIWLEGGIGNYYAHLVLLPTNEVKIILYHWIWRNHGIQKIYEKTLVTNYKSPANFNKAYLHNVSLMRVIYWDRIVEFQFILNANPEDSALGCLVYNRSLAEQPYTNFVNLNLRNNDQDYDIETGYYNENIKKFVVFSSHTNSKKNAILLLDTNKLNVDKNYTSTSKKITFYYSSYGDFVFDNRHYNGSAVTFLPVLTWGTDSTMVDKNIFVFSTIYNLTHRRKYLIYNGSPYANNQSLYPYAYNTSLSTVDLMNVSDKYVNKLTLEEVANIISSPEGQNSIINSIGIHVKDSTYKVAKLESPTIDEIYKGIVRGNLIATEAYDHGAYKRNYPLNNVTFRNFHVWHTSSVNEVNAGSISDKFLTITSVELLIWFLDNRNEIFTDLPLDFATNNLSIGGFTKNNEDASITVDVLLNNSIVNGEQKKYQNNKFTIKITNFDPVPITPSTLFNDINYFENNSINFQTIGSNIVEVNQQLIDNFIGETFNDGANYIDGSYDLLDLKNNGYTVTYLDNNLQSGTLRVRIKLNRYISNNNFYNDSNGPEQEYTISNFYRLNGQTLLNKSAIQAPSSWSTTSSANGHTPLSQIKQFIIDKQKEGVINTIESNYTDKSQEIFANLGNILEYHPEYLEILDDTGDIVNGIKYVRYRLTHTYDTNTNNSNITSNAIEGTIAIYGFKTSNTSVYAYNTTSIYADDQGVIGLLNGKQTITNNGGQFNLNGSTVSSDIIILSQQYLNSLDLRVALVYDPNRPNKIILQLYDALSLQKEFVLNAPEQQVLMWSSNEQRGFNFDLANNLNALGGEIYSNGTKITSDNFSTYFESKGKYLEFTYSYVAKQDVYISIPYTSNLFFNRLLTFADSSNNGYTPNTMFIYNQGALNFKNNEIDTSIPNPLMLVKFNGLNDPEIKKLNINVDNSYIYTASGYVDLINGVPIFSISYVAVDNKAKTWFRQFILNQSTYEIVQDYELNITSKLNFETTKDLNTIDTHTKYCYETFYYQYSNFSTGYYKSRNQQIAIVPLIIPTNEQANLDGMSANLFRIVVNNKEINELSITIKDKTFNNWLLNLSSGITNLNFSSDLNKMLFVTFFDNKYQFVCINLKKVRESRSILNINNSFLNVESDISTNNEYDKLTFAYALNNKPQKVYFSYASSNLKGSSAEIKQIAQTYNLTDLGINSRVNLNEVNEDFVLNNLFTTANYGKFFNKTNFNHFEITIGEMYKNYATGTLVVQVFLHSWINDQFESVARKGFVFIIKGFNENKQSTNILLTDVGLNYFNSINPTQYEEKIKDIMTQPTLLNQYFTLVNHPTLTNLSDALNKSNPYVTNIIFDNIEKATYLSFNVDNAYVQYNDSSIAIANNTITVEIPYLLDSVQAMNFTYSEIYGTSANLTPYALCQTLMDKPNGTEITKIKEAVLKKLNISDVNISDIITSNTIEARNASGEVLLSIQIPKLVVYDNQFQNMQVTISELLPINTTTVSKNAFYPTEIKPSMLQNWFDVDVENRALEFISIENPVSDPATKVISANVINFNDELKTARVAFTIRNVITSTGFNDNLTVFFDFDNLVGSADGILTSVKNTIEVKGTDIYLYAQDVANNNSRLISLLDNYNAISSRPSNLNITVQSSSFNNLTGEVYVVYQFDKYLNPNGDVVDKLVNFKTTITGFNKAINKTTVTYNNTKVDKTFDEFKNEITNDASLLNSLVNIENPVDGSEFTLAKAVLVDNNTIDVYARLDRYFSGDISNTIKENGEFKITVIRGNNNEYLVKEISFQDSDEIKIIYTNNEKSNRNNYYLLYLIPMTIILLLVLLSIIFRNKKFRSRDI